MSTSPPSLPLGATAISLCWVVLTVALFWRAPGHDFSSLYFAARLVSQGSDVVYAHAANNFGAVPHPVWHKEAEAQGYRGSLWPYVQNPLIAVSFHSLAANFSFDFLKSIVLAVNASATAATILLIGLMWAPALLTVPALTLFYIALTTSLPFVSAMWLGQTQPLILLAVASSVFLSLRQRQMGAGIVLGVAASIKIFPLVLAAYWMISGRSRAAGTAIAVVALSIAASMLADHGLFTAWKGRMDELSNVLVLAPNNQNILAFFYAIGTGTPMNEAAWQDVALPSLWFILNIGIFFLVAAAIIIASSGITPVPARDSCVVPFLFISTIMFSSIAWTHYYTGLVLAVPALMKARGTYAFLGLGLIWALNFVTSNNILWGCQLFSGVVTLLLLMKVAVEAQRESAKAANATA